MIPQNIVFIGAGNMARALIAGLRHRGVAGEQIQVHAPSGARRDVLAEEFGIRSLPAEAQHLPTNSVVIYAAKPKQISSVLALWRQAFADAGVLFLSVAAGISSTRIATELNAGSAIVRGMPNTPAQVGAGATALYARDSVNAAQRQTAEAIMSAVGQTYWLSDESLMDAVTALSGSGPAYVLLFLEALEDAAVLQGLDRPTARALALQTVLGTAQMAAASELSPTELRHQVTSPGGTTAAGLAAWAEHLRPLAQRALAAAAERSRALGSPKKDIP